MTKQSKIWRIQKTNPALQEIFSLKLGLSKTLAQILINRGITTLDEAKAFFNADIHSMHDPLLMKDMEKGVNRIEAAVRAAEHIRIFGDYDVDGITSTAILMIVLKQAGARVDYYIPQRLAEGYGMNKEAVRVAAEAGVKLIITVDSGITAWEEIQYAKTLGIDVVVTDHHEPPELIPEAAAVINPKQADCPYPYKELAGAGVALKLGLALLNKMKLKAPEFLNELACLGTIADIVPLTGENRIIVKQGLKLISTSGSIGIKALLEKCGISDLNVNSWQIAYQVAPRLNAAGRIGDASLGVQLLLSENIDEAMTLAARLCEMNEERQAIEGEIYRSAIQMIESGQMNLKQHKVLVLAGEDWHLGVMGIVASKLVQDYYRPVILLSIEGSEARGSARSIPPFNLYEALKEQEGFLTKYGGHSQAAGLTLPIADIQAFREAINRYAEDLLTEKDLIPEVYVDTEITFEEINDNFQRQLEKLAPYGFGNPSPVLACRNTGILEHKLVGSDEAHLKMKVFCENKCIDAIGFNLASCQPMLVQEEKLDIVFALEKNEWRGRTTLQMNLKDIRPAGYELEIMGGADWTEKGSQQEFIDHLFQEAVTYLTDDYYRDVGAKDEFYTKVVGVTFDNRQKTVSELRDGEELVLAREPENAHDTNAVRVERAAGDQVGYLNARLARYFAPLLDRGDAYKIQVSQVTGGSDRHFGVNVVIQKDTGIDQAEEQLRLGNLRRDLAALDDEALREEIRKAILGEYSYREKQMEAMNQIYEGFNTLAIFGTGRGKSAVFQSVAAFKALRNNEITIIIYPLRALVNDQFDNMSVRLKKLGLRVYKGNGSISTAERVGLFEAIEAREIDILLTTPEFITYHGEKIRQSGARAGLFVVDESHHIGLASASHRPIYKKLDEIVNTLGKPPVLAVTATANDGVADEIVQTLAIEKVVIDPHVRDNLNIVDNRNITGKNPYLKKLAVKGEKTIIYVNSRLQCVELAAMLRQEIPEMADKIIFYHAGLSSEQRNTIEQMFRSGQVTVVVSTSAFGEGIDIPDVKHVVVYHLNFNYTEFNQQSGRCGRNGSTAYIHLLCGRRDAAINSFILETSSPDRDSLVKLYKAVKELTVKSSPVTATNDEIAQLLQQAGVKHARPQLVSAGLGILEELNLVFREVMGRNRQIHLQPAPAEKLNLDHSLRYAEGQEEIKSFEAFYEYFFNASADELLEFVNRPIFPVKYLKQSEEHQVLGSI